MHTCKLHCRVPDRQAAGLGCAVQGGLRSLFVGVTPRLLQTMPSTMVYWFAVEGTRRALMKYVDVGEGIPEQQQQQQQPAALEPQQQTLVQQKADVAALQPAAA